MIGVLLMRSHAKWPLLTVVAVSVVIILSTALKSQRPMGVSPPLGTASESVQAPPPDRSTPATSQTSGNRRAELSPPGIPGELSADEQASRRQAQIVALDQRLRSEQVNQSWASEQEQMIRKAVAGSPSDGFNAPMPTTMEHECRSSICRIRMAYTDEEDAVQMHGRLTLGLGGAIATARTYFVPRGDGGVDMLVYAGSADRLR